MFVFLNHIGLESFKTAQQRDNVHNIINQWNKEDVGAMRHFKETNHGTRVSQVSYLFLTVVRVPNCSFSLTWGLIISQVSYIHLSFPPQGWRQERGSDAAENKPRQNIDCFLPYNAQWTTCQIKFLFSAHTAGLCSMVNHCGTVKWNKCCVYPGHYASMWDVVYFEELLLPSLILCHLPVSS